MDRFGAFCDRFLEAKPPEVTKATGFLWFITTASGKTHAHIDEIMSAFNEASLARPNITRLYQRLQKAKGVLPGPQRLTFRLERDLRKSFDKQFGDLFEKDGVADAVVSVATSKVPLLSDADLEDAVKMAKAYIAIFCLENSVRHLIEKVLGGKLGNEWHERALNQAMKDKVVRGLENERKRKWLAPRARTGPLYYLDWSDYVTIMRKFEADFLPFIGELSFLHRIEDLGNVRNVIAHNGVIASDQEFQRIALAQSDWQRQIGPALD